MNDFFDSGEDSSRLNRRASQVKEILLDPDGGALQDLLPDIDKLSFQICPWRGRFRHNRLSFWGSRLRTADRPFFSKRAVTLSRLTVKRQLYFSCPKGQYWLVADGFYYSVVMSHFILSLLQNPEYLGQ